MIRIAAALATAALAAGCPSEEPPQAFTCVPVFFCGPASTNGASTVGGCPEEIDEDECAAGDVSHEEAQTEQDAAEAACSDSPQPDLQAFNCVTDTGTHVDAACQALCASGDDPPPLS